MCCSIACRIPGIIPSLGVLAVDGAQRLTGWGMWLLRNNAHPSHEECEVLWPTWGEKTVKTEGL